MDHSGQIEFGEFLHMFRDELLELKDILEYIKLNPASSEACLALGATAPLITVCPLETPNFSRKFLFLETRKRG